MASGMNIMIDRPRRLVLFAVMAAATLPVSAAHAHCCAGPEPLYPYVVQQEPLYDVELAPTVFAPPYRLRHFPYVGCLDGCGRRAPRVIERRAVVEETDVTSESGKQRVIRAEAEVTILGPDRMNIRLFRKERGSTIHVPAD
jgi:hypothetical protein